MLTMIKRLAALAASCFVLAGLFTVAAQQPAEAAPQRFFNVATGACLQGGGGNLWAEQPNYCGSQASWNVTYWADGTRRLQNADVGGCVDYSGAGLRLYKHCWSGSDSRSVYQSWHVKKYSDGSVRFRRQGTNKCLDDSAAGDLRMMPCHNGGNQRWK